jgi:hypothetical protein
MFTRESVTAADVRRCVEANCYNVDGDWDGSDPVKMLRPAYPGSWGAMTRVTTPLGDVLNWLNRDCGYFDPIAMGM